MIKKKLLFASLISIFLIALLHILSLKFSWYYFLKWFDVPIHILGGFWVTVTSFWTFIKYNRVETIPNKKNSILIMLISVLIIGILWEIFELVSGNTSLNVRNYWQDTFTDVASGFVGGIVANIYFSRIKNY